jgi:hypothetical protein
MGISAIRQEVEAGRLELLGDREVAQTMQLWLGLSTFASEPRRRA